MNTAACPQHDAAKDLKWDLSSIHDEGQAISFVRRFEKYICVYSKLVEQLYSNYSIHVPQNESGNLVILPDPYAFHDTFFYLSTKAVSRTGLHIIAGEMINKQGLYLATITSQPNSNKKVLKTISFREGIRRILKNAPDSDPFLPVVMKGDLRQMKDRLPCLHLHRLHLSKLKHISHFDRMELKRTITSKLMALYDQ